MNGAGGAAAPRRHPWDARPPVVLPFAPRPAPPAAQARPQGGGSAEVVVLYEEPPMLFRVPCRRFAAAEGGRG